MNVEQALAAARALGLTRLDAALLLGHHLQRRREWLIAHPLAADRGAGSSRRSRPIAAAAPMACRSLT